MLKTRQVVLTSGSNAHLDAIQEHFRSVSAKIVPPQAILDAPLDDDSWLFIDWLLPNMSGVELCRVLRQSRQDNGCHVTMVLADGSEEERKRAIAAGADDYLNGPLSPQALVERIRLYQPSAIRRDERAILRLGEMEIDVAAFLVRYKGATLPIRGTELRLLVYFVRHPNRVFTRGDLIGVLGRDQDVKEERTVDVWVSRLRRSLQRHGVPHLPRTVRSYGYILDSAES